MDNIRKTSPIRYIIWEVSVLYLITIAYLGFIFIFFYFLYPDFIFITIYIYISLYYPNPGYGLKGTYLVCAY